MIGLKSVALGSKALVKEGRIDRAKECCVGSKAFVKEETVPPSYFIKNSTIANLVFSQFTS